MVEYGQAEKASHERGSGPTFADITGQRELKQALLAVGANDDLDGLLIQGEKGTAKSTAVRALGELLGEQQVIADCQYGCPPDDPARQCADCRERSDPPVDRRPVPLVTLPLGATRERVVGTLSVADALAGEYEFDPGLLARANRGILYVDEVNLLDDHLVDVLLDAAASGRNRVERDGVSVSHPAEFTLIGTMNPEEGDLRPQLRDRFALQATVTACEDIDDRVEIIEGALGTDTDGEQTVPAEQPRDRLETARESLEEVALPRQFKTEIAELCRDAGIDGHRGDIATARAARTLAALDGRTKVIESDVRRAAEFALPHRLRSRPFEDPPDLDDLLDEQFDDEDSEAEDTEDGSDEAEDTEDGSDEAEDSAAAEEGGADGQHDEEDEQAGGEKPDSEDGPEPDDDEEREPDGGSEPNAPENDAEADPGEAGSETPAPAGGDGGRDDTDEGDESPSDDREEAEGRPLMPGESREAVGEATAPDVEIPDALEATASGSTAGGSTRTAPSTDGTGGRVRSKPADGSDGVDPAASVRAAAARGDDSVQSRDLRQSVRVSETAALVLFVVDASASMRPAMRAAKGTLLDLLDDAYKHRDEVGFVAFAGEDAEVLLPPTDSVTLAARHLKELPTGDRTPLPEGLRTASALLERADPATSVVVLVTDGKANVADGSPVAETRRAARRLAALDGNLLVVDASEEDGTGLVGPIIEETDGERVPLGALSAERIDAAVDGANKN